MRDSNTTLAIIVSIVTAMILVFFASKTMAHGNFNQEDEDLILQYGVCITKVVVEVMESISLGMNEASGGSLKDFAIVVQEPLQDSHNSYNTCVHNLENRILSTRS